MYPFLDSTYKQYHICLCLTYFTQHDHLFLSARKCVLKQCFASVLLLHSFLHQTLTGIEMRFYSYLQLFFFLTFAYSSNTIISLDQTVGKGEGGMIWENGIEICAISYMKWVASPGSMHDIGCLGLVQRDGMGREEGGGFRMGNTCIPVADSFWYMAKPIQYCKVK